VKIIAYHSHKLFKSSPNATRNRNDFQNHVALSRAYFIRIHVFQENYEQLRKSSHYLSSMKTLLENAIGDIYFRNETRHRSSATYFLLISDKRGYPTHQLHRITKRHNFIRKIMPLKNIVESAADSSRAILLQITAKIVLVNAI
jgi:hypothetical protein